MVPKTAWELGGNRTWASRSPRTESLQPSRSRNRDGEKKRGTVTLDSGTGRGASLFTKILPAERFSREPRPADDRG